MKNKWIQNMLRSPKRTLRTLLFTAAFISAAGSGLQGCAMQLSGSSRALDAAMDDTGLRTVYESVGETVANADLSTTTGISDVTDAIQGMSDALERTDSDVVLEAATLVRVVDGDTLVVRLATGEDEKVRLIGINTPESVAPEDYRVSNSKEGALASTFVKAMLSDVTTVYLQEDTSDRDRYGRLLRYVWLDEPEDVYSLEEIEGKMLNAMLVMDGVAEAVAYEPDTMYEEVFEDLER